MRNLKAALWHGLDQSTSFQPWNHLAHGAQRHVQQGHQFALRDELAGTNAAVQNLLREALVSACALAHRLCSVVDQRQGGGRFCLACAHGRTTPFFSRMLPYMRTSPVATMANAVAARS